MNFAEREEISVKSHDTRNRGDDDGAAPGLHNIFSILYAPCDHDA